MLHIYYSADTFDTFDKRKEFEAELDVLVAKYGLAFYASGYNMEEHVRDIAYGEKDSGKLDSQSNQQEQRLLQQASKESRYVY